MSCKWTTAHWTGLEQKKVSTYVCQTFPADIPVFSQDQGTISLFSSTLSPSEIHSPFLFLDFVTCMHKLQQFLVHVFSFPLNYQDLCMHFKNLSGWGQGRSVGHGRKILFFLPYLRMWMVTVAPPRGWGSVCMASPCPGAGGSSCRSICRRKRHASEKWARA